MAGDFLFTLAQGSAVAKEIKGKFLRGHAEPRIAMVGRSNVGKSTLINALMARKSLARTSSRPGKTSTIQFYKWTDVGKILVDLPGYGFARVAKSDQKKWAETIQEYLRADSHLLGVLVLLDARHGPTDLDLEAIDFLNLENIPVTFVMTKSDQLKKQSERVKRKREVEAKLGKLGLKKHELFWISSKTKDGVKSLVSALSG